MRYLHFANIYIDTHNQLLVRAGETIKLAPKVYDVLVYFCQHQQRIISKDELMDEVWTGTLVTDNAISRTLVKVRKALDDDPKEPKFIVTVPRKGYRMLASFITVDTLPGDIKPEQQTTNELSSTIITATPTADAKVKSNISHKFLIAVIGLLTIAYLVISKQTPPIQQQKIQPLTRQVGEELYPTISPSSNYLAYTKVAANKPSYLNIKELKTQKTISVLDSKAKLSRPVWTPDGSKLAFLYKYKNQCAIYWASLANIQQHEHWQKITDCGANSWPYFVFSPEAEFLYFNDKVSASSGYQVFRINLTNSTKDIINQPITQGQGNYAFDLSPDGENIVLLNAEFTPESRIYTLNVANAELKQTAELNYFMRSVKWHHNGNSIVHPAPHPAYDLWQSNLSGEKLAIVVSNSSRIKHISRINNQQDYTFVSYLLDRDIYYQPPAHPESQQAWPLDNSSVMDYLPTLANNQALYAFVSKRSTHAQVYLANLPAAPDETISSRQISKFAQPIKLYHLAFSPDDSQLVVLADNQLFIADLTSMAFNQLPLSNQAINGVSWQDNNTLLFSTVNNHQWQLVRYDLQQNKILARKAGYLGGLYDDKTKQYYLVDSNTGVITASANLDSAGEALALKCQAKFITRKLNLKLAPGGLICQSQDQQLAFYDFVSKQVEPWQKLTTKHDFDINSQGLIETKMNQSIADIMQTTSTIANATK